MIRPVRDYTPKKSAESNTENLILHRPKTHNQRHVCGGRVPLSLDEIAFIGRLLCRPFKRAQKYGLSLLTLFQSANRPFPPVFGVIAMGMKIWFHQ